MTSKPTISAAEITKALDFRHACKKFDADKKISDQDMELILEAIRLTPTSYGFEQIRRHRRPRSTAAPGSEKIRAD